jgi:hypothetical protein
MTTLHKFLCACWGEGNTVFIVFDFFRNANYHVSIDLILQIYYPFDRKFWPGKDEFLAE